VGQAGSIVHEMSLCNSLIELIRDQQRQQGFERVTRVFVDVGVLGHVDAHALAFAFDVVTPGSPAAGARLVINEVPGAGWCMDCSKSVAVVKRGDGCPDCGGFGIIVEQGDELRLRELEVV
jgi:hydrogenase nickel incorporation protein HypA/HybF